MLSAQLTGNSFPVTSRGTGGSIGFMSQQQSPQPGGPQSQQRLPSQQPSQLPGVRSLTSPGARHSPFPPEVSPNTASSYQQGSQFRLNQQRAQAPTATTHLPGTNNGVTDYVRQEIRAIVGARQQGPRPQQQIQVGPGQSVSAADCEALGIYLEMPSGGGGGNESPKMWSSMSSNDMGVTSPPHRNNSSDSNASDQKASLLQKLLSE
uniref:Uncharacterized protein n=1 Tax=Cacopsylla melanoneura TaxID=428564 RepID=A0A8D8ZZ76_9HEMI